LIRNLTSLQELNISPADDVSTWHFVKELGELRELRTLRCTTHVRDESMERDLLESLANLHKIRTLCVFGSALARGITGEEACFVAPSRHLGQLCLECFKFSALPAWMNSTLVLNLTHLDVTVHLVQEQDMEILGRLPELCYLKLSSDYTRLVSIRKTTGDDLHRYFRKLRFFLAPFSLVQFDSHGCESGDDAATAPFIMMPSLEALVFSVYVRFIKDMDIQPGCLALKMLLVLRSKGSLQRSSVRTQLLWRWRKRRQHWHTQLTSIPTAPPLELRWRIQIRCSQLTERYLVIDHACPLAIVMIIHPYPLLCLHFSSCSAGF
jgi:hypothetical protein